MISYEHQIRALSERYPNAFVEPYDSNIIGLTANGWQAMHRDFHFWLGEVYKVGLTDCDDFAREFNAYVKRRHRESGYENPLGCYDLIYFIGGLGGGKHAINAVWVVPDDGGDLYLSELEPQPKGGLFRCTKTEQLYARLVCG